MSTMVEPSAWIPGPHRQARRSGRSRSTSSPVSGSSDRRVRVAVSVVVTRDAPIAQEGDRVLTHAPLRVAELRLGLEHHRADAVARHARGSTNRCGPTRTRDRRPGSIPGPRSTPPPARPATGCGVAELRLDRERRDEQLGAVPGHPRQVPREPRQGRSPSAEMRGDEKKSRPPTIVRGSAEPSVRHGHQLVHDIGDRRAEVVALAHADPPPAVRRDLTVCVPLRRVGLRRDRLRCATRVLPVEPGVGQVREEHRAAVDRVGAAAVLVHPRAGVRTPPGSRRPDSVCGSPLTTTNRPPSVGRLSSQ